MAERLPILDAEAHVMEPLDLWDRYLDPAFQARAPRVLPGERERGGDWASEVLSDARFYYACQQAGLDPDTVEQAIAKTRPGFHRFAIDGELLLGPVARKIWTWGAVRSLMQYLPQVLAGYDPASHVNSLRAMGVEQAWLYPTKGLLLFAVDSLDAELTAALVRAYNDWLREFCAHDTRFLRPVGALCQQDPQQMIAELERVASWGWKAVTLRPNPFHGRTLSDPAHEPFWKRCEELNIAVGLHEGTHARVPTLGSDRFRTHFGMHACSHPMEHMSAVLSLIEGGVLERHPRLRVGILESGCGWLPYWLWRLDAEYAGMAWEVREHVKMKPSDYFRRQCFITCEASEPGIDLVINTVGEDCVIFGSDYPHSDHPPHIREDADLIARRLSPTAARKLLWDNGLRFYEGGS